MWEKKVLRSDETNTKHFGLGAKHYFVCYHPDSTIVIVKHGGGSVMSLGWFSSAGYGKLSGLRVRPMSGKYMAVLEENIGAGMELHLHILPSSNVFVNVSNRRCPTKWKKKTTKN